jgi:transcription elongation factor S-II
MKLQDLIKYKEQIHKSAGQENTVLDLLNILLDWNASPDLLKSSKIGITVNELRKGSHTNKVQEFAKNVILKWKADVEKFKEAAQENSSSSNKSTERSGDKPGMVRSISSDSMVINSTKDKIRDKCIEMLYSACASETDHDSHLVLRKVGLIELALFKEFKETDSKYKAKVRSCISNLKDKNNPDLKERILDGRLDPMDFAKMTPEEMMSKDKQKQVEEAIKLSLHDMVTAADNQAETDMFKCGRCKQRKTKYCNPCFC